MDPFFLYLCVMFVFVVLSCLFLVALWSPAGKRLTFWLSCVLCFLVLRQIFLSSPILMDNVSYDRTEHLILTALLWVGGLE